MKTLTKAEEQIMQILWHLKEATVKEVVEGFEDTPPAYTTVATVLKVLEKKDMYRTSHLVISTSFILHLVKENIHAISLVFYLPTTFRDHFPKWQPFLRKRTI